MDTRELLCTVLAKNIGLAGQLFTQIQTTRPDMCVGWSDEFEWSYGAALLDDCPPEEES